MPEGSQAPPADQPAARAAVPETVTGSDELVRLLLDSTGEGIYGIDLDGNCTFANPACARILGFDHPDALLGKQMHELVHHTRPDGTPYPVKECRIYQAFRDGEGTHVDDELMFRADGSAFPAEYRSYPVRRNGDLHGCVLTFTDITERRENERLLREQTEAAAELARFPEINPGPALRLDAAGTVRLANAAATELWGANPTGRAWVDLFSDVDEALWKDICGGSQAVVLERQIGNGVFVLTHQYDAERGSVYVFGANVTEQKEAERALREKDELVRLLLNSTGEGMYGVDLDGNCTFANPACARILGFESSEVLIGRHMHDLVHHTRPNGTPYPVTECRIYLAFQKGRGVRVDDEIMFRADGSSFPAEYWSYPVHRDGEAQGCVVTFVDISDRRLVEEERRQTEKMAALGKLSAGLAHELNNPAAAAARAGGQLQEALVELQAGVVAVAAAGMTPDAWRRLGEWSERIDRGADVAMLSPLELGDREEELLGWLERKGVAEAWTLASPLAGAGVLLEDLDQVAALLPAESLHAALAWLCRMSAVRDLANVVHRSTTRLSDLVRVVKSYSYMDRAPVQNVDVHEGIEDTLAILQHKFRKSNIVVEREFDRSVPRFEAQGSDLNQVWTNLLDNAADALEGGGTITVRTEMQDGALTVEIADDGPGIAPNMLHQIFDPFVTTKEVGKGTGLGLDVARRIVSARCGGDLSVRSRPGETVFTVRIPLEVACDEPATANEEAGRQ